MKIYLYWLERNNCPYYVGVTRNKRNRYTGNKRGEMVFIDEFEDRITARKMEEYWIHQLRYWGFVLENKILLPASIVYKEPNLVEKRYKITKKQNAELNYLEATTGIHRDVFLRQCLEGFFAMVTSSQIDTRLRKNKIAS